MFEIKVASFQNSHQLDANGRLSMKRNTCGIDKLIKQTLENSRADNLFILYGFVIVVLPDDHDIIKSLYERIHAKD